MICDPCKRRRHHECPSKKAAEDKDRRSGLSPDNDAVQLTGLCPCQHKVTLMSPITAEEAVDKIHAGLYQECGCGAKISVVADEVSLDIQVEQVEFVRLWFEDHSHEDLELHGKAVFAATQKMRAEAR